MSKPIEVDPEPIEVDLEPTALSEEEKQEALRNPENSVTVFKMSGAMLAQISPVPVNVWRLKKKVEEKTETPLLLQSFVKFGDVAVFDDGQLLEDESLEVILVIDETNMWMWDLENNPCREMLEIEKNHAKCPKIRCDFVNVFTREPIRQGRHYFEFVMHHIEDEQSCGVAADIGQAGNRHSLRSLTAWTYYPGRMGSRSGSIRDGLGALHAQGKAVKEFKKLKPNGDVIGMLVDMEAKAIAFSLNGELQGACPIPVDKPLYVITHLDDRKDYVELRKPNIHEAPPDHLEALSKELLDISKGLRLGYFSYHDDEYGAEEFGGEDQDSDDDDSAIGFAIGEEDG
mmetsp:Transcript_35980/g.84311  ORF Transcript_35980/g.84311 Transcript_35980/m.84311 type:complete len:343 (+) Transcript_35980:102-1130(+)